MSHLETEKIEAILGDLKQVAIVAKKVSADKKVDLNDLPHVIGLLPLLPKFIADFKAVGEAFEEGKDIDVNEAVALIQKIHAMVKEVEAA